MPEPVDHVVLDPRNHSIQKPSTTTTGTTGTKSTGTTGTTTTGTTTTGTRYQGPAIVRTRTGTKNPASSEPGRNVTKDSAPANDTIVAKHPGPPNLMMHSGPPNLMMHPGPPQLHLPGGPSRGFIPPR
jgi:hypothetical protein